MKEFRLRVKKMILETLLYEDEFRVEEEKKEAKNALFAFMKGEAQLNKVEETNKETIENAMDKNDFHREGFSHLEEQPILSITYNHKDYAISTDIDKEYYYKTEDSSSDYPGHEEIKLRNINITNPNILVYNHFGNEFSFSTTEIGAQNFKHLEKVLKRHIQ